MSGIINKLWIVVAVFLLPAIAECQPLDTVQKDDDATTVVFYSFALGFHYTSTTLNVNLPTDQVKITYIDGFSGLRQNEISTKRAYALLTSGTLYSKADTSNIHHLFRPIMAKWTAEISTFLDMPEYGITYWHNNTIYNVVIGGTNLMAYNISGDQRKVINNLAEYAASLR